MLQRECNELENAKRNSKLHLSIFFVFTDYTNNHKTKSSQFWNFIKIIIGPFSCFCNRFVLLKQHSSEKAPEKPLWVLSISKKFSVFWKIFALSTKISTKVKCVQKVDGTKKNECPRKIFWNIFDRCVIREKCWFFHIGFCLCCMIQNLFQFEIAIGK